MQLKIDSATCQGHGRCYELRPDWFDADENGRGTARAVTIPESEEDSAKWVINACPEAAITAVDEA